MGTIPVGPTFVAGQKLTAAQLNQMNAVSDFWALTPRCYAYSSVAQSIPNTTGTAIDMTSEVYDIVQAGDSGSHGGVTNPSRIQIRTTGKYEITGQIQFASNATGIRTAQVRMNAAGNVASGTLLSTNQQAPLTGASTSVTLPVVEVALTDTDYVEMFATQTSGGALNTVSGQGTTFLRIKLTGS